MNNKSLQVIILILVGSAAKIYPVEYARKGTVELSGQASMEYNNTPDSRRGTTYYWLSLQPIAAYFPWDNWYAGVGVQGNFTYVTGSYGGWGVFGDGSLLGGHTIKLSEKMFAYGQLEIGISLPQGESAGTLPTNYYFLRPAVGVKYLISSAILICALQYSHTYVRYSYDTDYYSVHNLKIGIGVGFFF
jgi:hypothetical protein